MSDNMTTAAANRTVRRQLDALHSTLVDNNDLVLYNVAVDMFQRLDDVFAEQNLLSWDHYFPPPNVDGNDVTSRVFAVSSGLIPVPAVLPQCPKCRKNTVFYITKTAVFGWEYRCVDYFRMTSRSDAQKLKSARKRLCTGVVQATKNTWSEKAHSTSTCLALLFCWLNRLPVTAAAEAVGCGRLTAVDHYSMT